MKSAKNINPGLSLKTWLAFLFPTCALIFLFFWSQTGDPYSPETLITREAFALEERSPLAHINDAQTATLIVHGTADARVHPEQSLELYTAMRIKGIPSQLVFYPRQPHGLVERAHQADFAERVLEWFDRYVKGS